MPVYASIQSIFIIDDPDATGIRKKLEREHVRVRVNERNQGASFSRNRALDESSADWVLFLDDDVIPNPNILDEYCKRIVNEGEDAAGFVGLSKFEEHQNIFSLAVQFSYLIYFWGVSMLTNTPPWGVTANLLTRRTTARFELKFPKTGGGEDIDYCNQVTRKLNLPLKSAPEAIIMHLWWNELAGLATSPSRFHGWALGDSLLMFDYPEFRYWSWPANWEILVIMALFQSVLTPVLIFGVEVMVEYIFYLSEDMEPSVTGMKRFIGVCIAMGYKYATEFGHLFGPLKFGRVGHFCHRYDWWQGSNPRAITEKRRKERNLLLATLSVHFFISYFINSF